MFNTGMRTINALQARNIGEIVAGSLNIERTDEVYEHLGHMAMTVVVTGDLPCEGNFEITSQIGSNFEAVTIVSGENAQPIFNQEKFPKEPCVTMSKFYLASETPNKIEVTDNTLWALYWVFGVVKILFPKVGEEPILKEEGAERETAEQINPEFNPIENSNVPLTDDEKLLGTDFWSDIYGDDFIK
tara:strand:- start:3 stop:563 length:561 start_codon:yes stop_codon:yes gene_type:complete